MLPKSDYYTSDTDSFVHYTTDMPCLSTELENDDILVRMFKDSFKVTARQSSVMNYAGKDFCKTIGLNRDINDTLIYYPLVSYVDTSINCRMFNITISIPKSNLETFPFEDQKPLQVYSPY